MLNTVKDSPFFILTQVPSQPPQPTFPQCSTPRSRLQDGLSISGVSSMSGCRQWSSTSCRDFADGCEPRLFYFRTMKCQMKMMKLWFPPAKKKNKNLRKVLTQILTSGNICESKPPTVKAAGKWYLPSFGLFTGLTMATFTANLQCCRMDSTFAGASTWVSTSAGFSCGIEGEPLRFARFSISSLPVWNRWTNVTIKYGLSRFSLPHWRLMIGAFVFLCLVIATNYSMLGFVCHGLHVYGSWLNKNHRVDLWLLRVLVSMTSVQYLHS